MKGMIDGRRLKRAWDRNELGPLLLGEPPYEYETQPPDPTAAFTRLRQVSDFLRCQPPHARERVLPPLLHALEASEAGWARAGALFMQQGFGLLNPEVRGGAEDEAS